MDRVIEMHMGDIFLSAIPTDAHRLLGLFMLRTTGVVVHAIGKKPGGGQTISMTSHGGDRTGRLPIKRREHLVCRFPRPALHSTSGSAALNPTLGVYMPSSRPRNRAIGKLPRGNGSRSSAANMRTVPQTFQMAKLQRISSTTFVHTYRTK